VTTYNRDEAARLLALYHDDNPHLAEALSAAMEEVEKRETVTGVLDIELNRVRLERDGVVMERDRLKEECEALKGEHENMRRRGPHWMRCAIAVLHDSVDQTNPNDPVGIALTRAGLERRPDGEPMTVDSLRSSLASLRADFEEVCALYEHKEPATTGIGVSQRARIAELKARNK